MRVFLLRHGLAADFSPNGPRTDEERPLTREGVTQLEQACGYYARMIGRVDRILSSPLARARQTAEILASSVGYVQPIEEEKALTPGSQPARVLESLQTAVLEGTDTMALVGHEPHLGNLLGMLLTGSEQVSVPLRKGMLVGVRVAAPQSMIGRLDLCLQPRDVANL